jgi:hypothetical protein
MLLVASANAGAGMEAVAAAAAAAAAAAPRRPGDENTVGEGCGDKSGNEDRLDWLSVMT